MDTSTSPKVSFIKRFHCILIFPCFSNETFNFSLYRFDLIVTARDLDTVNTLSSTATLTLTITDINDNDPIFSQPIYYDNDIVENTLEISIPVSADDLDIDENDDLMYEIVDGNSGYQFVIGESKLYNLREL